MSGAGNRFIEAGYKDPKPLIEVDGKPIIQHVVELFPGESKFSFICNSDHLRTTSMRNILSRIAPGGRIFEIPPHKKGPVYAVAQIFDSILDDEEVIVNYCDFGTYWNYADFLAHTRGRDADGAIPSYRGFHPHMRGTTNYAFMRDERQWMLEIKEKEPFTDDRTQEFASNGTYYFRKGSFVKRFFDELMRRDIHLNGEYYVSLVYNILIESGLKVSIYEIQHMLQWGTPQDLEEYISWSKYFRDVISEPPKHSPIHNSVTLIPLAGRGSRFAQRGYTVPKPLIEISGKPMVVQAANALPPSQNNVFVALQEHLRQYPLEQVLQKEFPQCCVVALDGVTEGQAITCSLGMKHIDDSAPLLIAASDNGILFNSDKYYKLIADATVDAVIFTFRHHISSRNNPKMYGWVKTEGDDAVGVSVKVPISNDPYNDHAIVGTFYLRQARLFHEALEALLAKNVRVNNEFYVDSMMGELLELGYRVKVFEVEDYICWGTPEDYEAFVYWQSFFHKVSWHPYFLEKDRHIKPSRVEDLDRKYRYFEQRYR